MRLISYLLLIFPIASIAQSDAEYLPIISSDHSWIYSFGIVATNEYTERYTYSMDSTLLDGSWYHERLASGFEDGSQPTVEGLYREHEGKLYKKSDIGVEVEQVVVDMTLRLGDTIDIIGFSGAIFTLQVIQADTITLADSISRKRLYLTCKDGPLGGRREWIEGIGDLQFESGHECPYSWTNQLRCYSGSEGLIYTNPDFQPCWLISSTAKTGTSSLLRLMPNPAQEYLQIESDHDFTSYDIIDMSGKVLLMGQVSSDVIDISQLGKGIHVIKLSTASGLTIHTKFVKQ